MTGENITYYAIVGADWNLDAPHGLARRRQSPGIGILDEALTREFTWRRSGIIATWEHATFSLELAEVSERQAEQIIKDLRTEFG